MYLILSLLYYTLLDRIVHKLCDNIFDSDGRNLTCHWTNGTELKTCEIDVDDPKWWCTLECNFDVDDGEFLCSSDCSDGKFCDRNRTDDTFRHYCCRQSYCNIQHNFFLPSSSPPMQSPSPTGE